MPALQIRLTAEQHALVAARAAEHGLTPTEYGRGRVLAEPAEPPDGVVAVGFEPEVRRWVKARAAAHEMTSRQLIEAVIRRVYDSASRPVR